MALKIWIDEVSCDGSFLREAPEPSPLGVKELPSREHCTNLTTGWVVLGHDGHPNEVKLRDGFTTTSRGVICAGCTKRRNASELGFHVNYVG